MKNPMLVYLGVGPIHAQALHEQIEDLGIPNFRGVTIRRLETDNPIVEVMFGPPVAVDAEDPEFYPDPMTPAQIEHIGNIIRNHDFTRSSRLGQARKEEVEANKQMQQSMRNHSDPAIRFMADHITIDPYDGFYDEVTYSDEAWDRGSTLLLAKQMNNRNEVRPPLPPGAPFKTPPH